jgi:hypothetical protein
MIACATAPADGYVHADIDPEIPSERQSESLETLPGEIHARVASGRALFDYDQGIAGRRLVAA